MSVSKKTYKTSETKRRNNYKSRNKRLSTSEGLAAEREYQREYRKRHKERLAAQQAERQRDPEVAAWNRLQRKGIKSPELMPIVLQTETCQICGGPPDGRWKTLHVDHCHSTGGFRGMLCHSCNNGLANFKDDPEVMRKAAAYIEQYRKMLPNECL